MNAQRWGWGLLWQYFIREFYGETTKWSREECEEVDCLHFNYDYGACNSCFTWETWETQNKEKEKWHPSYFVNAFCRACSLTKEEIAEWYDNKDKSPSE